MADKKITSVKQTLQPEDASSLYTRWHQSNYHFLLHWGIFLIGIAVAWGLIYTRIGNWLLDENDNVIELRLPQKAQTELLLEPQTETVSVGDTFETKIILDTGNESIDGVDIYSLHYDPTLLRVLDDLPDISGTQIKPGDILPLNAANIVDADSGTIKLGQVATGGTSFKGKGTLATIRFRALATGTAYLKFDFTLGNTIDSNAAFRGKDRLTKVVDAIYIIERNR